MNDEVEAAGCIIALLIVAILIASFIFGVGFGGIK